MTVATRNFHPDTDPRLNCSCCGASGVRQSALDKLQQVRDAAARPLQIRSAFRCARHPEEARKPAPGQHYHGVAFDIAVSNGAERCELVELGLLHGARGVGVANSFVHLDWRAGERVMWKY